MSYEIRIENFEGPLDLLLHLIRKNEMDIYDIPMAEITAQYLATLDAMQSLNLDLAGEFLLMASTLIHIKSRLLLPPSEEDAQDEEEEDPRAELVRRLLEYQKYKEAAVAFDSFSLLGRDVFARKFPAAGPEENEEEEFEAVGLYELMEAFRHLIKAAPPETFHEVDVERLSVTDRVNAIMGLLADQESLAFTDLFPRHPERHEVVVTFLAMLELVKLRMVRLMQNRRFGMIRLYPSVAAGEISTVDLEEDSLGYC
jgi:segregation and condensation protein A